MTTDLSFQIPARFAGEPSDGTTVEPGALETCIRKMPTKAAKLIRTRAQRIPFRPGYRYSNKGRIHSRRPILSSSSFRLQYGGGPYIPDCWSFGSSALYLNSASDDLRTPLASLSG